jgi:hypothetical protein
MQTLVPESLKVLMHGLTYSIFTMTAVAASASASVPDLYGLFFNPGVYTKPHPHLDDVLNTP